MADTEAMRDDEQRRKEWVTLSIGRVCVWEIDPFDQAQFVRRVVDPITQRDPAPGSWTNTSAFLWFSCYDGDGEDAQRVFSGRDDPRIDTLPDPDLLLLSEAMRRVNADGTDSSLE